MPDITAQNSDVPGLDTGPAQAYPGLLQVALRRVSLVVFGVVAGALLGALYYYQTAPIYESKAQLLVIKKRPEALPVPGWDSHQGGQLDDYLSTQVGILKSPLIVGRAVKENDLASLNSFRQSGDAAAEILGSLKVSRDIRDTRNGIMDLSFRGGDKDDCTAVLNALIESYSRFLAEKYQNVSDETVKLITRARDILEKDLSKKERAYREFRIQSPVTLVRGKDGNSFNQEQLLALHGKKLALQFRRSELQGRLSAVQKAMIDGRSRDEVVAMLSQLTGKAQADGSGRATAALEDRLLPVLLEEKMLLEKYGDRHPRVQEARQRIEIARQFVTHTLKQELADIQLSERTVADVYEQNSADAKRSITYEIEDEGFRADIARTQQLYDVVLKRLQEVDIVKDFGGFDAQAIAPPTVGNKVAPKLTVVLPLAMFFGVLGGLGLAAVAEFTDKTFRSAEEIRRRLGLSVIGHIPVLQITAEGRQKAEAEGSGLDPILCSHYRSKSRETECYRGVRTSVFFSTQGETHKAIQITSPNAGDGKTTLTANLAVCMAQSGKTVLLVDADLRKPRQHTLFGINAKKGFASLLQGESKLDDVIQTTPVPGLSFLPCGKRPANPAELLTSRLFPEFLETVRERYDFILIDSPPVLAVTDPCVIASHVDGVLLTFRIVRNGRAAAQRARDVLGGLGAKLLGIVVNGVDLRNKGYGGYGYEGYAYSSKDYSYGRYAEDYDYYQEHEGATPADEDAETPKQPLPAPDPPTTPTERGRADSP